MNKTIIVVFPHSKDVTDQFKIKFTVLNDS